MTRIQTKSKRKYAHVLSSFAVQAKIVDFIRFWMTKYWQRDWETNPDLISYCKRFIKKIRKIYKADTDNWEPVEIEKGKHSHSQFR